MAKIHQPLPPMPACAPRRSSLWRHVETGEVLMVVCTSWDVVDHRWEVCYTAMKGDRLSFHRPVSDHPRAFISLTDDGKPRFEPVSDTWWPTDRVDTDDD